MRGRAALVLLAAVTSGHAVHAEPCVGVGYDRALPGAQDVVSRMVDVPSAQFPAFWQEGLIGGYFYRIFADGTGVLRAADDDMWRIDMSCGAACAIDMEGTPPEDALRIAGVLGECLIGESIDAADFAEAQVEISDPATVSTPPAQPVAPPCGRAAIEATSPVDLLQQLLIAAGEDPGPVDGIWGPRTRQALLRQIGDSGADLSIPTAIDTLDSILCARVQ